MKRLLIIVISLMSASVIHAETLHYDATIGADGKIKVAPSAAPKNPSAIYVAPQQAQGTWPKAASNSDLENLFIVKDPAGAVKGIYASQSQALEKPMGAGDVIEALPAKSGLVASILTPEVDTSAVKDAAAKVAQDMLEHTRAVMCQMKVRPQTFTTGAEISFSFFAGTTLQVSATWESDKVCTP